MPHNALKKCHIVAIGQWKSDWPQPKVKNWVQEAGGKISFQAELTDETTHVVILEKTWKEQGDFVKKVLAAKADEDRDIHLVKYEWLQDSLMSRSKKRESPYSFERMQKDLDDAARKADKERAKIQKALEPRSASGLMAQVFTDSTDKYMSGVEQARADRAKAEAARVRQETKAEEKLINEKRREAVKLTELAAVFRRGVNRSRNELLSENHHIYMDQTGFHYDVLITKIKFKTNQNQRHTLTIYESHLEPHTYAFNCQYSGTNVEAQNDIIATLGSNWPTAYRAFKTVFKEKTQGNWEDRIKDARARYDSEKRLDATPPAEQDFDKAPFVYHPPVYGPRGGDVLNPPVDVSPSAKPRRIEQVPDESGRAMSEENVEDMAYMSGANGTGAVTPPREHSPEQPVLPGVTNGIADNDAFQQLIANNENIPDDLDFLDGTAFDEPFDFGDTNFDEAMANGVETACGFIDETQTQPSSQLPDTQDLGPNSQIQDTQNFGHTQIAEQAHADLVKFVNGVQANHDQPSGSDREFFGEESPEAQTHDGAAVGASSEIHQPGASVLEKRKISPEVAANEEGPSPKKVAGGQADGI